MEAPHAGQIPEHGVVVTILGDIGAEEIVLINREGHIILGINGQVDVPQGIAPVVCTEINHRGRADHRGGHRQDECLLQIGFSLLSSSGQKDDSGQGQQADAQHQIEVQGIFGQGKIVDLILLTVPYRQCGNNGESQKHRSCDPDALLEGHFFCFTINGCCGHHSHDQNGHEVPACIIRAIEHIECAVEYGDKGAEDADGHQPLGPVTVPVLHKGDDAHHGEQGQIAADRGPFG